MIGKVGDGKVVGRLARAARDVVLSPVAPDAIAWLAWFIAAVVIVAAWFF